MALSFNAIFNPAVVNPQVPPPAAIQLLVTVQSATAEDLASRAQRALLDIQERNVAIVADQGPAAALWLSDATLSGGGDGHTFVLEMLFLPKVYTLIAVALEAIFGSPVSLAPENFRFQFALAGDAESLPPLYDPMLQALFDTVASPPFQSTVALGIFNLSAGAAKGTRFMMGVGALLLPEQEFLARASSEASTSAPRTVSDVLTAARALLKKK